MSKHIKDETYKGMELTVIEVNENNYAVDVRSDDFDGDIIAGYTGYGTAVEAQDAGRRFIDGYTDAIDSGTSMSKLEQLKQQALDTVSADNHYQLATTIDDHSVEDLEYIISCRGNADLELLPPEQRKVTK